MDCENTDSQPADRAVEIFYCEKLCGMNFLRKQFPIFPTTIFQTNLNSR